MYTLPNPTNCRKLRCIQCGMHSKPGLPLRPRNATASIVHRKTRNCMHAQSCARAMIVFGVCLINFKCYCHNEQIAYVTSDYHWVHPERKPNRCIESRSRDKGQVHASHTLIVLVLILCNGVFVFCSWKSSFVVGASYNSSRCPG
jgi:hypothetical protein